jgi:hypothetical protein
MTMGLLWTEAFWQRALRNFTARVRGNRQSRSRRPWNGNQYLLRFWPAGAGTDRINLPQAPQGRAGLHFIAGHLAATGFLVGVSCLVGFAFA